MTDSVHRVTRLLEDWARGDRSALDQLLPLVYEDLHRQAARMLRRESPGRTLQTTALVHEAYLRLVDQHSADWRNRAHFLAVAAQLMRRILVDHARRRHASKRGGKNLRITLHEGVALSEPRDVDLLALDDALIALSHMAPREAQIIELRFFGGLTIEETARVLDIAPITVRRDWDLARAWLYRELMSNPKSEGRAPESGG